MENETEHPKNIESGLSLAIACGYPLFLFFACCPNKLIRSNK
jgi:hypothetical protein